MNIVQALFPSSVAWDAIVTLLQNQLPGVTVDPITDKDFDASGDLILNPPAVRVMYANSTSKAIENQAQVYSVTHNFLILCGDEDRRSNADQARASLQLAERVKPLLAGARLLLPLPDGETFERSEPISIVDTEPLPIKDLGAAYAFGIEVPGTAVYPAANANPEVLNG